TTALTAPRTYPRGFDRTSRARLILSLSTHAYGVMPTYASVFVRQSLVKGFQPVDCQLPRAHETRPPCLLIHSYWVAVRTSISPGGGASADSVATRPPCITAGRNGALVMPDSPVRPPAQFLVLSSRCRGLAGCRQPSRQQ